MPQSAQTIELELASMAARQNVSAVHFRSHIFPASKQWLCNRASQKYACQVHEREREIAGMEAAHKASVALLEEQLLNAESRLARESEQCRSLEHRCGPGLHACTSLVSTPTSMP